MPSSMVDLLRRGGREVAGQADATGQLLKGLALQPISGLAGASQGIADLIRGKGLDESLAGANRRIEQVQGWGGGPVTERGGELLQGMGETLAPVVEKIQAPADYLGEKSPLLGAAAMGFTELADPTKSIGKVKKAASAAKTAIKVAKGDLRADVAAAMDAAQGPVRQVGDVPGELKGFGEAKAAREAATAAKLEEQAVAAPAGKQTGGSTAKGKVAPDVYRQQYAAASTPEQGYQSVLASALRGGHLRPAAEGGWVGMPRTVQTRGDLTQMRRGIDKQFNRGVEALELADPDRLGTWYDRAKAGQAEINEPHQLERGLEGSATYSAGVAPESEHAFNLKHQTSRALGEPVMAYRGAPMRALDKAVAADEPLDMAFKVGEYRGKNDPRVEELSPFGVNDFRMAQTFGYTDPSGAPWHAGASETMHPVMDAETALAVNRARERSAGGKQDWTGSTLQEIPWVLNKAEDIYGRGKNTRFSGGTPGMIKALREANNTLADYFPKHGVSAPGAWATEGPMVGMDFEAPRGTIPAGSVGAGERDALYRAAEFRQQPVKEGMARPQVDFQTVPEKRPVQMGPQLPEPHGPNLPEVLPNTINPNTRKALEAIEGLRATVDARPSGSFNLPVTGQSRTGKSSMLLERPTGPSSQETQAITDLLRGDENFSVQPTNRGALVVNQGEGRLPKGLEEAMPGATPVPAAVEGGSVPGVVPGEAQGQGIATSRMLERFAEAPPELSRKLGESEEIRRLIRQKIEAGAPEGRVDVQKMRNFMAEADWPKAVEMMRKGIKPAAALSALGYSLQGMAAEPEQRGK